MSVFHGQLPRANSQGLDFLVLSSTLSQHRDGGLYSINIALNSGFIGGGTFFDGLLTVSDPDDCVLKPCGPGHAVAHRGTERHAGAPTTAGIREILVLFVTSMEPSMIERSRHVREMADSTVRLEANRLAAHVNPDDAEAHFWTGLHFLQPESLKESIRYLERAAQLCPTDSRTFLYLGIAYSKSKEVIKAKRALQRVLVLEVAFDQVGFHDATVTEQAVWQLKELGGGSAYLQG